MTNLSKISNEISESSAAMLTIDEGSVGQRIDNYLTKTLKGVPKSHLYRILRSGEVRVNKKRIDATYKLVMGDLVRIPPIRATVAQVDVEQQKPVTARLEKCIVFEDDAMLVLDKPAGMAVHGGSGVSKGVIEQLRLERPQAKFLELVHRLDRETSGVLMVGKKRSALVSLHEAMRRNQMDKRYFILVKGRWTEKKLSSTSKPCGGKTETRRIKTLFTCSLALRTVAVEAMIFGLTVLPLSVQPHSSSTAVSYKPTMVPSGPLIRWNSS